MLHTGNVAYHIYKREANLALPNEVSNFSMRPAKDGFLIARQKGSHIILKRAATDGTKAVVVPNHKEIDKGTLLEIIRQAGMKKEKFLNLL